jgi:hypothetical protein
MVNEQCRLILAGLRGSHPLGALAAFGLLRCLSETSEFGIPRLHWELQDDWLAVLTTEQPISREGLASNLLKRMGTWHNRCEFIWEDKIDTNPQRFADTAREAVDKATPHDRRGVDFFASFGCELIIPNGKIKPTAFQMTSGNQAFLKLLRELAESLSGTPTHTKISEKSKSEREKKVEEEKQKKREREIQNAFYEALFGPWRYKDVQHSLGWDPTMERLHALRSQAPTKDKENLSVRAAVWLAAEALPLFPCAPAGGTLITRGFTEQKDNARFSWPIWECPLAIDTIRSLLALKALTEDNPPLSALHVYGIVEVFRSQKVKTGGDSGNYRIFRPAYPCIERKA